MGTFCLAGVGDVVEYDGGCRRPEKVQSRNTNYFSATVMDGTEHFLFCFWNVRPSKDEKRDRVNLVPLLLLLLLRSTSYFVLLFFVAGSAVTPPKNQHAPSKIDPNSIRSVILLVVS